jgi:2-C-methyl-D-erythritol 4-phosphate cytidylyltransferase / 2-C-methyl-D-erythritol 2,4-cyclodiphosphate synthase
MAATTPVFAVVVAAGKGLRLGGDMPKQFRLLAGVPVYRHAVRAFIEHPMVDQVVLVGPADDVARLRTDNANVQVVASSGR